MSGGRAAAGRPPHGVCEEDLWTAGGGTPTETEHQQQRQRGVPGSGLSSVKTCGDRTSRVPPTVPGLERTPPLDPAGVRFPPGAPSDPLPASAHKQQQPVRRRAVTPRRRAGRGSPSPQARRVLLKSDNSPSEFGFDHRKRCSCGERRPGGTHTLGKIRSSFARRVSSSLRSAVCSTTDTPTSTPRCRTSGGTAAASAGDRCLMGQKDAR